MPEITIEKDGDQVTVLHAVGEVHAVLTIRETEAVLLRLEAQLGEIDAVGQLVDDDCARGQRHDLHALVAVEQAPVRNKQFLAGLEHVVIMPARSGVG
ncbi:MAG: hypothetical protein FJ197_08295 [Gammaproteobacteria bacterium]|nr:hypothetical protein [Gammaproteobacteria bacterium]